MATDNELQIVLSLIDNASAELKKVTGEVNKSTQEVTKATEKTTKSIKDQFKEASAGLKDIRRAAFIVVAAFATIIASVKEAAKYNYEAKKSFDKFTIATKNLSVTLGSSLTQGLEGITKIVKSLNTILEASIAGFVKYFSFIVEFWTNIAQGPIAAYKRAMEVANLATDSYINKVEEIKEKVTAVEEMKIKVQEMSDAMSELNMMYLTGKITAQQYYDTLTSGEVANFQNMQTRMQLTQQLAAQENLMNNQSLMDYSTNVQARMGLLKTFQDYHHTVYASMMDFANMTIQKFSTGMTTALTSIIMGTKKASDAFKEFGITMVTAIVEFVIQYGIQMMIAAALSKIIMASTIAQASAIAMAWYPAALYASIATMGAASATGLAALSTATGIGIAGEAMRIAVSKPAADLVGGKAEGGWVGLHGPEIALVGERGPEYVVPNNRLNQMGGNQISIHIEINNPSVRSYDDIDTLTEEISKRISHEIERIS